MTMMLQKINKTPPLDFVLVFYSTEIPLRAFFIETSLIPNPIKYSTVWILSSCFFDLCFKIWLEENEWMFQETSVSSCFFDLCFKIWLAENEWMFPETFVIAT